MSRREDRTGARDGRRNPVRVKVCGLTRRQDAVLAAAAGASYLGVILVPGTPRFVPGDTARGVVGGLGVPTVAVVADLTVDEAVEAARSTGASVIQLHGEESPELAARIRNAGPWTVWKAVRVREGSGSLAKELERYGPAVDGVLLDRWDPVRLGGTGEPFRWEAVQSTEVSFPPGVLFVAAGGLNAGNVQAAIRRLSPDVVDVSSGVEERPGVKDAAKVKAFIAAVRTATRGSSQGAGP